MTRIERMEEKWQRLEDLIGQADSLMWMGHKEVALSQFKAAWQTFRREFPTRRERDILEYDYLDGMSTVMNRIFCEIDDDQKDEQWKWCWEFCHFFEPGEIWIEMYASHLGQLMQERGLYAECDQWFEDHMAAEPDEAGYAASYALCLWERGEKKRAEAVLDAGLEAGLANSGVLIDYGLIAWELYAQMGQREKALRCVQRLKEEDLFELDDDNRKLYAALLEAEAEARAAMDKMLRDELL